MGASLINGIIGYPTSSPEDGPASPAILLSSANNVLHTADQTAQVIVSDIPTASDDGIQLIDDGSGSPVRPLYARYGPFELRHTKTKAYKVRVRLAGYETASSAQTLRAVLTVPSLSETERDQAGSNTADFAITGSTTSVAWYESSPKYMEVSGISFLAMDTKSPSQENAVGSEYGAYDVQQFSYVIDVYNVSTSVSLTCRYSGMVAAEFTPE